MEGRGSCRESGGARGVGVRKRERAREGERNIKSESERG